MYSDQRCYCCLHCLSRPDFILRTKCESLNPLFLKENKMVIEFNFLIMFVYYEVSELVKKRDVSVGACPLKRQDSDGNTAELPTSRPRTSCVHTSIPWLYMEALVPAVRSRPRLLHRTHLWRPSTSVPRNIILPFSPH